MEKFTEILKKYNSKIDNIFSEKLRDTLNKLYKILNENDIKAFITGGIVRDIFLGKNTDDIDIVVDKDTHIVADIIFKNFKISDFHFSKRFLTYNIILENKINIDVVLFREEVYESSGALPQTTTSSIEKDYIRRDFTINSMYISMDKEGKLYDFANGLEDIKNRIIRILHDKSFEDDPTRILRGLKFSARYNFSFDENTERLIRQSISENYLAKISEQRLRNEIFIVLGEKNLRNILTILKEYHIFEFLKIKNPDDDKIDFINKAIKTDFFMECKKKRKASKKMFTIFILINDIESIKEKKEILRILGSSKKHMARFIFENNEEEKTVRKLNVYTQNSLIYKRLKDMSIYKILYLYFFHEELKGKLESYIFNLCNKNAIIDNMDLISNGFSGERINKYLNRCFEIQLDLQNPTKEKIIKIFKEELKRNGNL